MCDVGVDRIWHLSLIVCIHKQIVCSSGPHAGAVEHALIARGTLCPGHKPGTRNN